MVVRLGLVGVLLCGLGIATVNAAPAPRPVVGRPDVLEVGEPLAIGREVLNTEMMRNSALRNYIEAYGWPDFAEVQEVTVEVPFAPYEVRLYYVRRNHMLAFSRVYVSPAVTDFGQRKFDGTIPPAVLARLMASTAPPVSRPVVMRPVNEPEAPSVAVEPMMEPFETETTVVTEERISAPGVATDEIGGLEEALMRMEAAADRAQRAADAAEQAGEAAQASAGRAERLAAGGF